MSLVATDAVHSPWCRRREYGKRLPWGHKQRLSDAVGTSYSLVHSRLDTKHMQMFTGGTAESLPLHRLVSFTRVSSG